MAINSDMSPLFLVNAGLSVERVKGATKENGTHLRTYKNYRLSQQNQGTKAIFRNSLQKLWRMSYMEGQNDRARSELIKADKRRGSVKLTALRLQESHCKKINGYRERNMYLTLDKTLIVPSVANKYIKYGAS